jgi:hypothetical protein
MSDLRVRRGDSISLSVDWNKADGSPQSLAGWTLRFTARDRLEDVTAVITKSSPASGIVIDDSPGGLATISIAPADTASFIGPRTLWWDVQAESGAERKTIDSGKLYVIPDVTRT